MSRSETYFAVIGDLVASRESADRPRLQERLRAILGEVGPALADRSLRAGPSISAGDSFQALFDAPDAPGDSRGPAGAGVVELLREVSERLEPDPVAFGLGFGEVTTPVIGVPVHEVDGPCFHRARAALAVAKREDRWAFALAHDPEGDAVVSWVSAVNATLRAAGDQRRRWTERQREVVRARRAGRLQKEVAEELDVSPSVVSEVLKAARFDLVLELDAAAATLLDFVPRLTGRNP
ncbi:MAG: SatD family protein [bacterium]